MDRHLLWPPALGFPTDGALWSVEITAGARAQLGSSTGPKNVQENGMARIGNLKTTKPLGEDR